MGSSGQLPLSLVAAFAIASIQYTAHQKLPGTMGDQRLNVKTVGVIGGGVSGVATAIHLRKSGLNVKVFERNPHIGGVWYVQHHS